MRADAGAPGLCSSRGPVVLGGVLPGEARAPQALHAPTPRGDSRQSSVVAEALGHAETSLPGSDLSSTFLILTSLTQKPSCCPRPPPQAASTQFLGYSHCLNPPLVSCSKAPSFPALYPQVDSVLPRPKALSCKYYHCGPRDGEPALHAGVRSTSGPQQNSAPPSTVWVSCPASLQAQPLPAPTTGAQIPDYTWKASALGPSASLHVMPFRVSVGHPPSTPSLSHCSSPQRCQGCRGAVYSTCSEARVGPAATGHLSQVL